MRTNEQQNAPYGVDELLLGIRTDLFIANHALLHEEEMPPSNQGEVYYTILRIIQRFDFVLERYIDALGELPTVPRELCQAPHPTA